jgi:hypothetical protein
VAAILPAAQPQPKRLTGGIALLGELATPAPVPFAHLAATARNGLSFQTGQAKDSRARRISWRIENPSKDGFVLRNTGDDIAENVELDVPRISAITRNPPRAAVVRPGEGSDMLLIPAWGHPLPNQPYVRWAGQDEWVAVPLVASH